MSEYQYSRPAGANSLTRVSSNLVQRQGAEGGAAASRSLPKGPSPAESTPMLSRAAAETPHPIHEPLRTTLNDRFGFNFSLVKVHSGPASAAAAERIGARAYTLGTDIYLGAEAHELSGEQRDRLLAHEAMHTVQQGGHPVSPHAGLAVSDPADSAEREAESFAESVTADQKPSRSLALRDQMRASMPGHQIARSVSPQIQRDLKDKKGVRDGDFDWNLKTVSNAGGVNGMTGTIKFTASDKGPDSDSIRLLQVARDQDLTTGKENVWAGGEANRNKVMTTAAKDVDPGYFVDVLHAGNPPHTQARTPRTNKADAEVLPYYIEDYGKGGGNEDGSKKGKTVTDASLADFPSSSGNRKFSFETAAKATKGPHTGYVYATLTWGFTVSDASKGKVEKEHAAVHRSPSATFGAAVNAFNEFYKNPGASTAP